MEYFFVVWLKRGNTSLNFTKVKIIAIWGVMSRDLLSLGHTPSLWKDILQVKLLKAVSAWILFPFDLANCWAFSTIWGRISIKQRGGRGTCQHKQRWTACCQWEMSAFIATSLVDPLWTIVPKSKISFSQDVAQVITFPKEVMSLSLTSDC